MPFCVNCGTEIVEGAKFCQKCGHPTNKNVGSTLREQEFSGKIYKCPNCGEALKSFVMNCPACGHELRGVKATNAVKEFALKLEAIESKREYERPRGIFAAAEVQQRLSKTDEQKISLIKNFSVPNSKEDMLEFMILASSCMSMKVYDSFISVPKSEREITEAWFSKVQQVYEKAKRTFPVDNTFLDIKALYDNCIEEMRKSKKRGTTKWLLLFGWWPILLVGLIIGLCIVEPKREIRETERLEGIVVEVQTALENEEYKHALRLADSIDYQRSDDKKDKKWEIEREYWIDKVIEEAEKNGIILERPKREAVDESEVGGFIEGLKEGIQPGFDSAKDNLEEFNRIMNGEVSPENSKPRRNNNGIIYEEKKQ